MAVDPASAGWQHLDFTAHRLVAGQAVRRESDDRERLVLVLEGRAEVRAGDRDFGIVGSRASVFDGPLSHARKPETLVSTTPECMHSID